MFFIARCVIKNTVVSSVTSCYVSHMTRFGIDTLKVRVKTAVEAEGLRPFARRAEVGIGVVRSLLNDGDPSFTSAEALARAVSLDFGFGPERETGPVAHVKIGGEEFAHIPLHSASLAAGDGIENGNEEIIDHLAFRRSWLKRIHVTASKACLARVTGESMEPTLHHGDLILIDTSRTEVTVRKTSGKTKNRAAIYAVIEDGTARVKRIERPEPDLIMLLSDNPAYSPEALTGQKAASLNIIGKVVWWGHTNRE